MFGEILLVLISIFFINEMFAIHRCLQEVTELSLICSLAHTVIMTVWLATFTIICYLEYR